MKCPKCSYIGFEQTDRCRNCGYDFALSASSPEPDLPLRKDDAGPFCDFDLGQPGRSPESARPGLRQEREPRVDTPPHGRTGASDLPLFGDFSTDELPIVAQAAAAPPLAVRRSTPPLVRTRPRVTPRVVEPPADAALPLADAPAPARATVAEEEEASASRVAGITARLLAALLDWALLLGADGVVVYFTLKICRLAASEILVLPLPPLLAFLVLLNGGYLALLTAAGGQTLGKMVLKLKVVGTDDGRVTVARSIVRTLALLVSVLPAGLGLVPALFATGHRGLHDWLAATRVVRVDGT